MTQSQTGPQEVLRGEIVADARRQAERVLRHAKEEAEEAIRTARQEADKIRADRGEASRGEAQGRRDLILASLPVRITRMRADRMESSLRAIHDEARQRLLDRQGFDYHPVLVDLAAGAVAQMAGASFVLELAEGDLQAYGAALAEEVRQRLGRGDLQIAVAPQPAKISGGVLVRDADGRQLLDNSLLARLERLWPAMRRQIGARAFNASSDGPRKES